MTNWEEKIKRIVDYITYDSKQFDREDLEQAGWLFLMLAQEKFDPVRAEASNATFDTFAFTTIRNKLWALVRKRSEMPALNELYYDKSLRQIDNADHINYLVEKLSENERQLFYAYFIQERSTRDVAKDFGVSATAIGYQIRKIRRKMRAANHAVYHHNRM